MDLKGNLNKYLHKITIPYGIFCNLLDALVGKWKDVLYNIPNLNMSQNEIFSILEFSEGKNPSGNIFQKLGQKGVKLIDLIASFEKIKFEKGLEIMNYEHRKLEVKSKFASEINLPVGSRMELYCDAIGFPFPRYFYYKSDLQISTSNPFIIESSRYATQSNNINVHNIFL